MHQLQSLNNKVPFHSPMVFFFLANLGVHSETDLEICALKMVVCQPRCLNESMDIGSPKTWLFSQGGFGTGNYFL